MNKISGIVAAAAFIIAFCASPYCSEASELEQMAGTGQTIKVFLAPFSNESGQGEVKADDFREEVAKAFTNRRSVSFKVVGSPAESDVQVSGIIRKYQYLEKDPIRPSPTTATLILDAITTENFAEMTAEFTVTNTKTGNTAWKNTVTAYTKRMMTPAESVPLIYDKVARGFVSKAFGKGL